MTSRRNNKAAEVEIDEDDNFDPNEFKKSLAIENQ